MGLLTPNNFKRTKVTNMVYPSTSSFSPFTTSVAGMPISYVNGENALNNINIFSVINRISNDVSAAHFKTENLAALQRLENPTNGIISRSSFWQGVLIQLCACGNAYVPLVGQMENIPPSDVQINYLPGNSRLQYIVAENNERPRLVLDQSEILHFRLMPDPAYRSIIGKSPLESLRNALKIDEKSTESQINNMDNQMNPTGKLTINNVLNDNVDLQTAREEFEKANAGKNAGRLMVLPDGFTYDQFEMKSDVFKALNQNASFSADQISRAFGVPSAILGGGAATEAQHSNTEQIKSLYLSNLIPYTDAVTDELRIKMKAPDLKLDIKSMLDVDDSILIEQITRLVNTGTLSPNQAQMMMKRTGFLPQDLPNYEPQNAMKGGERNENNSGKRNDN